MFNPNLKLEEIFVSNSLRNMTTHGNNSMPHKPPTYFLWVNTKDSEIGEILTQGNDWIYRVKSVNSYIDIKADSVLGRHIIYGPNSSSSSLTVEITEREDSIRVVCHGWGSSVTELYDGDKNVFLEYLKTHQKREA